MSVFQKLGFKSYQEYLQSDRWKRIRAKVFRKCGKCKVCGNKAEVVHHKNYDEKTLRGDCLKSLVPLCHSCHYKMEFTQYNKKNQLSEANRKLRKGKKDKVKAEMKKQEAPYIHKYVCEQCKESKFAQTPDVTICTACKKSL